MHDKIYVQSRPPQAKNFKVLLANMPEKQSDNRVQFWTHFYVASILIED